jgi:MFS family permease
MLVGFAINGIAQGFIFIPLLPDALEAVFIKEDIIEGHNEALDQLISDYGSGLYGTFFSTGQILAPIVGSAIFEQIGYRPTTDFMTAVCLCWCLFFFVFNVGFSIFSKERKIKERREALEKDLLKQYEYESTHSLSPWAQDGKSPKADNDDPDVLLIDDEEKEEIVIDGKVVRVPGKKKK